ncbi:HAD hydrolase-like protein [Prescottella equi]|uniref:HAD hydrolase-like protein n=1 Tax=Rhodococcus hoagii TaxID=43767 RepID=A0A9Q2YW91_RHOHA|nr:HAD hydrolase-like protein [Prescottella equi]MBM4489017.1 HAD hydrolase-like protein [Prescottella equi]MBM4498622.1 HAD hydrolase-like protein [Prescottella equi]MBM4503320.1 HAD hydrolase-like protein [Prescottella equi]MBM4512761.1 HAD hydrolase-like protein [Prescottella equi]MBM4549092.1 HAD hydrolase-like protein [Prescottella equi]
MTTTAAPLAPVLLFDLDGTLTDSALGIHNGFRHALAAVGAPAPTAEMLGTVIGPPLMDSMRGMGLDDAATAAALAAYFERYDAVGWSENQVYDGVEAMLAAAGATGARMAVATSKTEKFAIRILEHFGLADYFEVIGGASSDGSRRAKADVIGHVLGGLGLSATTGGTADVVMIGDREHDVHGAGHWGIPTVFVEWGYGATAEAGQARWTAPTVADLTRILTGTA